MTVDEPGSRSFKLILLSLDNVLLCNLQPHYMNMSDLRGYHGSKCDVNTVNWTFLNYQNGCNQFNSCTGTQCQIGPQALRWWQSTISLIIEYIGSQKYHGCSFVTIQPIEHILQLTFIRCHSVLSLILHFYMLMKV